MSERRPSNSELRLRRLASEEARDHEPSGILEIFDDADEPVDADAPLAREAEADADDE
jgi:hypothetical protein